MEGILEHRAPGVMGRWEKRWFILDGTCLRAYSLLGDGPSSELLLEFPLEQIQLMPMSDSGEISLFISSKKNRLRGEGDEAAVSWHTALRQYVDQAQARAAAAVAAAQQQQQLQQQMQQQQLLQQQLQQQQALGGTIDASGMMTTLSGVDFQTSSLASPLSDLPPFEADQPPLEPPAGHPGSTMKKQDVEAMGPSRHRQVPGSSSPTATPSTARPGTESSPTYSNSTQLSGRHRIMTLYEMHMQKLKRLEDQRELEAELERQRLESESDAIKAKTRRSKAPPGPGDAVKTAERLYNEHRFMRQRMEDMRQRNEYDEQQKIHKEKMMSLPTRSPSDSSLLTCKEASDRLYTDAERRQEWLQFAKDARAKEEMTMIKVGAKGSGRSSLNHCLNLHKEAHARSEKRKLAAKLKEQQELDACRKESVSNGKRGPTMERIKHLYEENEVRQKRLAQLRSEKASQDQEALELPMKVKKKPSRPVPSRGVPPWADENFWQTYGRKRQDPPKDQGTKVAKGSKISQADYAFLAVHAALALRSGYDQYNVRPQEYRELVRLLKNCMGAYREAVQQLQQDPGYAALCNRMSQRLFQETLLPEVEGWSHRLEPDPVRQVEDDLDQLLSVAAKAHEGLKERVAVATPGSVASSPTLGSSSGASAMWASGGVKPHPQGVPTALWARDPGVKSRQAAETKALVKFGPGEGPQRYRHLLDLSRLLLVFANCDMLQAGLDHILKRFEVVDVRNYFATPGRLGLRHVEILVVEIVKDGREQIPHVCELRLEVLNFHNASKAAQGQLDEFYRRLRSVYSQAHMCPEAVQGIAHNVLNKALEGHRLRAFRCHLARRFGSTVAGWRRALGRGGGRLLPFQRLRDVCYSLHCGEHVTELWEDLDPGRGGCISLWELDPEAVALLVKLRARFLSVLGSTDNMETEVMFGRLSSFVRPVTPGQLELHEFRTIAKPLGLSVAEADRAFACLDAFGGSQHAPPAVITAADIAWLKRLPNQIFIEAVRCGGDDSGAGSLMGSLTMPQELTPPLAAAAPGAGYLYPKSSKSIDMSAASEDVNSTCSTASFSQVPRGSGLVSHRVQPPVAPTIVVVPAGGTPARKAEGSSVGAAEDPAAPARVAGSGTSVAAATRGSASSGGSFSAHRDRALAPIAAQAADSESMMSSPADAAEVLDSSMGSLARAGVLEEEAQGSSEGEMEGELEDEEEYDEEEEEEELEEDEEDGGAEETW